MFDILILRSTSTNVRKEALVMVKNPLTTPETPKLTINTLPVFGSEKGSEKCSCGKPLSPARLDGRRAELNGRAVCDGCYDSSFDELEEHGAGHPGLRRRATITRKR